MVSGEAEGEGRGDLVFVLGLGGVVLHAACCLMSQLWRDIVLWALLNLSLASGARIIVVH